MLYNQTVGQSFRPAVWVCRTLIAEIASPHRKTNMISRRDFLKTLSAGVAAGAMFPGTTWAAEGPGVDVPGKAGMIVRSARFLDLEMPPEFFSSWITPVPHFFVRNHMHEPASLDVDSWKLSITGEVETPVNISLADLAKLESHTVTNTLE